MKTTTVILYFTSLLALAFCDYNDYVENREKDFVKANEDCQADVESAADNEEIRNLRMGQDVDSPKLRKHVLCMTKKLNMINDNGRVNEVTAKKDLQYFNYTQRQIKKIIKKCSAYLEGVSEETGAMKTFKCFQRYWEENREYGILQDKTVFNLGKADKECQSNPETAADEKDIRELILFNEIVDTPQLRKHIFCMNKKIGLQKENGEISEDLIALLSETSTYDKYTIKKIIKSCHAKSNEESVEAFALRFFKCLRKERS